MMSGKRPISAAISSASSTLLAVPLGGVFSPMRFMACQGGTARQGMEGKAGNGGRECRELSGDQYGIQSKQSRVVT
jgi:hypothetical protein